MLSVQSFYIILGIFVKNCLNVFPDKKKVKSRDILAYKQFVAQIHEQSRTGGVMVSELASSVVDRGVEPDRVKPKTIELVLVASPLSTRH